MIDMIKTGSSATIALFLTFGTGLQAATSLIDFSTAETVTTDTSGNYWNSIGAAVNGSVTTNGGSIGDLLDLGGSGTGWSIAVTYTNNTFNGGGGTGVKGPTPIGSTGNLLDAQNSSGGNNVYIDGLYSNRREGVITISLTNLAANTDYVFEFVGGREAGGDDGAINVTTGTGWAGGVLLNTGDVLSGTITSDSNGSIVFTFVEEDLDTSSSDAAMLNAMSITAVPEPSSTAMCGMGVIAIMLRRRRK